MFLTMNYSTEATRAWVTGTVLSLLLLERTRERVDGRGSKKRSAAFIIPGLNTFSISWSSKPRSRSSSCNKLLIGHSLHLQPLSRHHDGFNKEVDRISEHASASVNQYIITIASAFMRHLLCVTKGGVRGSKLDS